MTLWPEIQRRFYELVPPLIFHAVKTRAKVTTPLNHHNHLSAAILFRQDVATVLHSKLEQTSAFLDCFPPLASDCTQLQQPIFITSTKNNCTCDYVHVINM